MIWKSVRGIVAGALVAVAGYWIAAVIALLMVHGVPLGSAGGPPTVWDASLHLVLAAAASFVGGLVAVRSAGHRPLFHALAVGGLVATLMFLGFSKPASTWPGWFPYGMALACGGGALLAGRFAGRRKSPI